MDYKTILRNLKKQDYEKGLFLVTEIVKKYDLIIKKLTLIDSHFGTEIFLLESEKSRYIVKTLPLYVSGVENEGCITEYLFNRGIKVARLLKTINGEYLVKNDKMQFHVQEFIEGETFKINTAPNWFLSKTAEILGKVHQVLKEYNNLEINFGNDFFNKLTANNAIQYYSDRLNEVEQKDISLISELKERLRHLNRISKFDIDTSKMTYLNSHGDFHIGQIITKDRELTIIDWTSSCRLPIALEIIMSYTTADPNCKYGKIDCDKLKKYVCHYSKNVTICDYDLQIMPYIFYFQQIICHYPPPYNMVAETYKPICNLINNFTNWLYENVEVLSKGLCN